MDLHLRRGRLVDPLSGRDGIADLIIRDGRVAEIGSRLATPSGAQPVDCDGLLVVPGLIDLHTHLREPGQEYKEDIASGTAAAVAGGFTAVCCMANTVPPNDNRAVTDLILRRAQEVGKCRVYPIGAVSRGLKGESLAEIGELHEAGCVALSDDGLPVMNTQLLRRAMEYARGFGLPIIQHAEDLHLSAGTCMNEGPASTQAGMRGQPAAAEDGLIARDLALVELTGARYHVAHVSTVGAVRLIRDAKARGLPVSCEVTPHHLILTDEECLSYDTCMRVNPPLRRAPDVEALREGLRDGTIDAVATDHAPHSSLEKDLEFDRASPGMLGLETALGVVLGLVDEGALELTDAIERLTSGPARTLGLAGGAIREGAAADVAVVDLAERWDVEPDRMVSKSRNTPFAGRQLVGRAVLTLVGGRVAYDARGLVEKAS